MASFKDCNGRLWEVAVNVQAFRRVKSLIGYDLSELVGDRMAGLLSLAGDPIKLVDILYCVCKPQADSLGITDEHFGEAMAGDAVYAATQAFVEEYINFFPDPRMRAQLKEVWRKQQALNGKMMDATEKRVKAIDVEAVANRMEEELKKRAKEMGLPPATFGPPSGDSQASSESTLPPSPSES